MQSLTWQGFGHDCLLPFVLIYQEMWKIFVFNHNCVWIDALLLASIDYNSTSVQQLNHRILSEAPDWELLLSQTCPFYKQIAVYKIMVLMVLINFVVSTDSLSSSQFNWFNKFQNDP